VAVFGFEARPARALFDETHFDFAGVALVRLKLPLWADIPAEDNPIWGLVGENTGPSALGSVCRSVVDVTSDFRLELRLGDVGSEQVVLWRLEIPEAFDKCCKCLTDRCIHDDLAADDRVSGHVLSSSLVIVGRDPRSRSALDSKRCRAGRAGQGLRLR